MHSLKNNNKHSFHVFYMPVEYIENIHIHYFQHFHFESHLVIKYEMLTKMAEVWVPERGEKMCLFAGKQDTAIQITSSGMSSISLWQVNN